MSQAKRAFCSSIAPGRCEITDAAAHHLRNVLKVAVGDRVEVFDGAGAAGVGRVAAVSRSAVAADIEDISVDPPVDYSITLACAIPKQPVQPCLATHTCELGVARIAPVVFERSAVKDLSTSRWRRWMIESCRQSGRNRLPELEPPVAFDALVGRIGDFDAAAFGSTGDDGACRWVDDWRDLLIVVGPEGGLTTDEESVLIDAGAAPVRLGRHILRIETAATALAAGFLARRP